MSLTWRVLLGQATDTLDSAADARRILEQASGHDGAELLLHLDDPVTEKPGAHAAAMVERRRAGEPLQYVLGRWGFRRLDLFVDRRVLIPRPETEVVAGVAMEEVRRIGDGAGDGVVVVDLGTGSGAIALAVADECPGAQVWATDASAAALEVARANLAGLPGKAARRVRLVEGDWFAALPPDLAGKVGVVVSNPPYVATDEPLPAEVRDWEPAGALFAGPSGSECLETILGHAPRWLSPTGSVVLEIAPHQTDAACAAARAAGFAAVEVRPDLAGRDRVLLARRA